MPIVIPHFWPVFIFIFIFSPIVISSVDFFICWVHVVSFLLKSFDFQVYFLTRVIKTCKCWIQFIELVLLRLPFCSSDQRETVFFFFFHFPFTWLLYNVNMCFLFPFIWRSCWSSFLIFFLALNMKFNCVLLNCYAVIS